MPTYTYSNGNFSSTTNIVNGMAYTQNIMMLGATGSGCGDKPCPQGYSLYFPCLKNITRGEDACFEFYVVDNAMKDVVDLREVEALTISLTGNFGCPLGTYTYPGENSYIKPLQTQTYKHVVDENFVRREVYTLTAVSIDEGFGEMPESNMAGTVGLFYEGGTVRLEAFDTRSYIFVGWSDLDSEMEDECDDMFVTNDRVISFEIHKDTNLAAIYRRRRSFRIHTVEDRAFYKYRTTDGADAVLHDGLVVEEGRHLLVRAMPKNNLVFSGWDGSGLGNSVHTDTDNIVMEVEAGSDIVLDISAAPLDGGDFSELNFMNHTFDGLVSLFGMDVHDDTYVEHTVTENTLSDALVYSGDDISDAFGVCVPSGHGRLHKYHAGANCLLKFGDTDGDGWLDIPNPGISDTTVVEVFCAKYDKDSGCSISVSLDGIESQNEELSDGLQRVFFTFGETGFETMRISSIGEIFPVETTGQCLVDRFVISDIVVVDKGKAALCLPGSVTAGFHRGKITVTGAVMIGGKTYGLPCTMAGTVTGNPVINTIIT